MMFSHMFKHKKVIIKIHKQMKKINQLILTNHKMYQLKMKFNKLRKKE